MSRILIQQRLILSLFALALFYAGLTHAKTIATVNGDSITTDMMAEELGRIHMLQMEAVNRADFSPERLLQKMINNRLIVQEAIAIGLAEDTLITGPVTRFRESLAYRALLRESVPDSFAVTPEEVEQEFSRWYERYDVRFLCVPDSTQAILLADSIRRGAEMDQIARAFSVDKYKDDGGLSANNTLRMLPVDLRSAFASAAPGDLFGPVQLWRVWATLRFENRRPADPAILDSVRTEVTELLREQKRSDFKRQFVDSLRQGMRVVVDSTQIDSVIVRMLSGELEPELPAVVVGENRKLVLPELRKKYIHRATGQKDRFPRMILWEVLAEQLDVMVLKEAASRAEYTMRPQFDERTQAFTDSLLIIAYLSDVVAPSVSVSHDDIAAYYEQYKSYYRLPTRFKVASLTRATEDEAKADYNLLTSGTDFAWLAKRNSIDLYKEKGGERDWLDAAAFAPVMRAELDSLPVGGIVSPKQVDEGWVLMQLVDRQTGEIQPLDQVEGRIRAKLTEQKQFEAIDAAIRALRETADIRINDQVLQDLMIAGPTEELE